MPLPLILEPTAYYLLLALPLGGALLGMAGYMIWGQWRRGWPNTGPVQVIALALMIGIGGGILVQPIGWRFTCDRDGLSLKAPLDMFATHETIKWGDLTALRFGATNGRSGRPSLQFVGKAGATITVNVLDGVPDAYWPLLASAIAANAPGVWHASTAERDNWVESVRETAGSKPVTFGWHYRARDGEGRVYSVSAPTAARSPQ